MKKLICAALVLALVAKATDVWKVSVVTVPPTTATRVDSLIASNSLARSELIIINQGTNDCYYGRNSSVSTTNGILLKANGGSRYIRYDYAPVYIYSTGGTTVGVEEGF